MDFPHQAPAEQYRTEPEFSVNTYNTDHGGKGIPMKLLWLQHRESAMTLQLPWLASKNKPHKPTDKNKHW